MSSSLDIAGKKMHCIRDASASTGYSRDYITKLAREHKIYASQVGRQWFVDLQTLEAYAAAMALEQKERQLQLSEERKRERLAKEAEEAAAELSSKRRTQRSQTVVVAAVLFFSFLTGAGLQVFSHSEFLASQSASLSFATLWWGEPAAPVPPAIVPAGAEELQFSHEAVRFSTIEDIGNGMLLLPDVATSSLEKKQFFSDHVQFLVDEQGQQYVARVDDVGRVVEKIPYVIVPVKNGLEQSAVNTQRP